MRTLLIDADILLYKASFGAEKSYEFEEGQWALTADLPAATVHLDNMVAGMKEELKADAVIMCLSDDANWRKALYPAYKVQRKKTRKPLLLKPLRAHVEATYKHFSRPSLEADDVLGILMTAQLIPGDKIICTIDKDLLQVPGRHFNIDKRTKRTVTEAEGDRLHMMQTLTGDIIDNYPGCPGIGPSRAAIALDTRPRTMWEAVITTYISKGLTEDDALIQARIARITRVGDYDFQTKSVRLWTPPSP